MQTTHSEARSSDTPTHLWRSPMLGTPRTVTLRQGTLQYFERGDGPALVFAHGWLANGNLWRRVVDALADRFRCITLDLPFGSHRIAVDPGADLTPPGCGKLIADAIDALGLSAATLVGNDSGGCYSQIATAARPQRIARLVLNSCETIDDAFPPEAFGVLPQAAQSPQGLRQLLTPLEDRSIRMTPAAYGLLLKRPIDDLAFDSYVLPCLRDDLVLRDATKVMSSASAVALHEAGLRLIADFDRPVLFAWSPEDRVFPVEKAKAYAARLKQGRVALIDDAYSFTPEDQPQALARAIATFVL
jgi:pimeloyl-ACP methyl ester carboxylesterase